MERISPACARSTRTTHRPWSSARITTCGIAQEPARPGAVIDWALSEPLGIVIKGTTETAKLEKPIARSTPTTSECHYPAARRT